MIGGLPLGEWRRSLEESERNDYKSTEFTSRATSDAERKFLAAVSDLEDAAFVLEQHKELDEDGIPFLTISDELRWHLGRIRSELGTLARLAGEEFVALPWALKGVVASPNPPWSQEGAAVEEAPKGRKRRARSNA